MSKTKIVEKIFKIKLVNAQKMNKKYPATFQIPTKKKLKKITIGSIVKVCDEKERFWVIVKEKTSNQLVGKIDNNLISKSIYNRGDLIKFEEKHIYDIY